MNKMKNLKLGDHLRITNMVGILNYRNECRFWRSQLALDVGRAA
jgi:hypothetical protein